MSSRSHTSRSSLRALRTTAASRPSWSVLSSTWSRSCSVLALPRMTATGVRSSCETALTNVLLTSSAARRRSAASRSASAMRRSPPSASRMRERIDTMKSRISPRATSFQNRTPKPGGWRVVASATNPIARAVPTRMAPVREPAYHVPRATGTTYRGPAAISGPVAWSIRPVRAIARTANSRSRAGCAARRSHARSRASRACRVTVMRSTRDSGDLSRALNGPGRASRRFAGR